MAYGQNMNAPMSGLMSLAAMKGRMGDNTLVHVNPMELKALDAMAPGGLTKNPTTGLPEAFKLKDALPILLGIAAPYAAGALMGLGAGTAATGLAGAAAAGAGSAAGTALAGGNKEEILTSGLLSGVTAGMIGGAGGGASSFTKAGQETLQKGLGKELALEAGKGLGVEGTKQAISQAGLQEIGAQTFAEAGKQAVTGFGGQALKQAAGAGLGGLSASGFTQDVPEVPRYERPEQVTIQQQTPTGTPEQQRADIDRYIRQGGAAPTFFNYSPAQVGYPYTYAQEGGSLSETPRGEMFSGMVEDNGNGDGMSDNVEFEVVGDPEIGRAMLSPDEYVMDAYTVAALGNGSADAGADKLDKFREALRKKVYGSKEQPNEIDGAKELSRLA